MAGIACEGCSKLTYTSELTYSTDGRRLCPTCCDGEQIARSEQAATAALRRERRTLVVVLVLLVGVPAAMIALGQGRLVSTTLGVVGALVFLGGLSALRMQIGMGVLARNAGEVSRRETIGAVLVAAAGFVAFLAAIFLHGLFAPR